MEPAQGRPGLLGLGLGWWLGSERLFRPHLVDLLGQVVTDNFGHNVVKGGLREDVVISQLG